MVDEGISRLASQYAAKGFFSVCGRAVVRLDCASIVYIDAVWLCPRGPRGSACSRNRGS